MATRTKHAARKLRTAFLVAAMVALGGIALSQERGASHPETYVVKRGDTLWDIAGRFLRKPWLWPEIWQANPQVQNPHLIYPGDVLSLAYLNRVQVQPGARTEQPVTGVPLADIEPFLRDMRILDNIDSLPYVVGVEEDRTLGTQGQSVYVRGLENAQVGQRYAVLRPVQNYVRAERRGKPGVELLTARDALERTGRVRDYPHYDRAWTELMYAEGGKVQHLGTELRRVNAGAVRSLPGGGVDVATVTLDRPEYEVRVGDRLVPVETIPYDLHFFPHPPKNQFPYRKAQILGVADRSVIGGPRDVVVLSVGARDGVDNGTVFSIWRVGSRVVDRVKTPDRSRELVQSREQVRLPDEYSGHVMVFRTFDNISYGLVMDSVRPSKAGYELNHPDTPY